MAHKTFSQEQLKWEEYNMLIVYKRDYSGLGLLNFERSISFILKSRSNLNNFSTSTNLIFQDKISFRFFFSEKEYFRV